jgi:iron complex outermembrane receptor protein
MRLHSSNVTSFIKEKTIDMIKWGLVPAAFVSFGMDVTPAMAQDGDGARARIENVTVTARKREEASQSVPLAMTALTTQLEKPTVRDLSDLNGFSANVRIEPDQARGGGINISIRGINPVRTDDNSFDAPIAVMIDGVHLGILSGQLLENFDLERVEILRGPQGTLFGKNTVGGVINVIRSRPTGEFGARLKYTVGKNGQHEARSVFNVPVIEDVLAFKGFFTYIYDKGYIYNENLDRRQPTTDYQNFGGTFLFTPGDKFEALVTVERFHDDGEGGANLVNWNTPAGLIPAPADPRDPDYSGGFVLCTLGIGPCRANIDEIPDTVNGGGNPARLRTTAVTANLSYQINENHRLVSITAYRKVSEDRLLDYDGTSAPFITIDRDNDYKQFSQELRYEGTFGDRFDITAGVYYWRSEFEQDWITGGTFWNVATAALQLGDNSLGNVPLCQGGIFAPLFCDPHPSLANGLGETFTQVLNEAQVTKSIAVFAQADYEIIDNWTITAGIRWTEEKKDFMAGQAYLTSVARSGPEFFDEIAASLVGACAGSDPADCSNGFATLDNKWTNVSPKFGLSWQATDDVMVFGSFSKGFHSGGFFGVNQNIRDFVRDQYDPEIAETWELGIKSQLFNNTLQANLTLFRNNFKGKQESNVVLDPDTNTVATAFVNAADARYQGLELEVQWVVNENLNFFGSLGYLDAGYSVFSCDRNPNDAAAIIVDCSDLTPRAAPEITYGIGGTYSIPVGNDGVIDLYLKYSHVGKQEGNLVNIPFASVDSREDLTASITYSWDKFSISVYGTNLTNDQIEFISPIATLFASSTITPPRSWGIEIQGEF